MRCVGRVEPEPGIFSGNDRIEGHAPRREPLARGRAERRNMIILTFVMIILTFVPD